MEESYSTVKNECSSEFTEKRSKFIGHTKPVYTEDDAISFIEQIKSNYWDAKHNVYAYILKDNFKKRYSDDGEPQGTAGIPILETMEKIGVTNCVVVVTRYFGGILLGTGGLVRAYSKSAGDTIKKSGISSFFLCKYLTVQLDYSLYGKVLSFLNESGAVVDNINYAETVEMSFYVKKKDFDLLKKALYDITSANIKIKCTTEKFFAFDKEV